MRHAIAGNRLGRNSGLRRATIRDVAKATLTYERIRTTKARAKEARKLVDRLITLGKENTLAAKRRAFAIVCDHQLVSSLFNAISPRFKNRAGGYTRIIPLPLVRRGDNAQLAYLELTEKGPVKTPKPAAGAKAKLSESASEKKEAVREEVKEIKKEPRKEVKHESKEIKKEAQPKAEIPIARPAKDLPPKEKGRPKNIIGGIKKIFNKKSP